MDEPKGSKSRRITAWAALIWGSLLLLRSVFGNSLPAATQTYQNGQSAGLLTGLLLVCAGAYYLFLRKI